MSRKLGDTVYFDGEALGTIADIKFVEGVSPITLHETKSERTTALRIIMQDGSSFFEPHI